MPLVAIQVVEGVNTIPPTLVNHVTPGQYQQILNAILAARQKSFSYACMIEWGVCLVTCLWCVFFAHPCIEESIIQSELVSSVGFLNRGIFEGRPVLSAQNGTVYVNTELCHVAVQSMVMAGGVTVVQMSQPQQQQEYIQAVDASGQPVYTQNAQGQIVPMMVKNPAYQQQHHHHHQQAQAQPQVVYATAVNAEPQYATVTVEPVVPATHSPIGQQKNNEW